MNTRLPAMAYPSLHQMIWSISRIDIRLRQASAMWADRVGVCTHQWIMLAAIADLDTGRGVRLRDLASYIHADKPKVVRQAMVLESIGYISTKTSLGRKAEIILSLSDRMRVMMSSFRGEMDSWRRDMFGDENDADLIILQSQLIAIDNRLLDIIQRLAKERH